MPLVQAFPASSGAAVGAGSAGDGVEGDEGAAGLFSALACALAGGAGFLGGLLEGSAVEVAGLEGFVVAGADG
jgi:hypothetical protein